MEQPTTPRKPGNTRNSNIELLRIFAMLMIIGYHADITGFSNSCQTFPIYFWNQILGNFGILGVDLFVVISAWFCVDQAFHIRRVIAIVFQTFTWVMFYVILSVVYNFVLTRSLSTVLFRLGMGILGGLVQPFWVRRYWFVSAYFYMMLLSPLMNKAINDLPRKVLKKLLILLAFVPIYYNFQNSIIGDATSFAYTYLLVGYLKRHCQALIDRAAKPGYALFVGALYLGGRLALWLPLSPTLSLILNSGLSHTIAAEGRGSLIMLVLALLVFAHTVRQKPWSSKYVNSISGCCLGVYMFHENHIMEFPYTTNFVFKKLTKMGFINFSVLYPLQYFSAILLMFAAGTALDLLRQHLIQKPFMHWLNRFEGKLARIDAWFCEF